MVQQILDDLRTYFEAKTTITPEEQALLQRLKDDFFPITSVSREDLQTYGFDTRSVTDAQMRRLVQKMANDYCEQLFWSSMEIIAEGLEFRVTPNVRFAPAGMFVSMGRKVLFVVKVAGRSGMNICMFWLSFLTTRLSSKKNISVILRLVAVTMVHVMFPNTIIFPILRNTRSRTDISNRLGGRNHNYTFFKTSLTMISIV